jgi:photosystem II stability/assembly factor-like uncharacterized protein
MQDDDQTHASITRHKLFLPRRRLVLTAAFAGIAGWQHRANADAPALAQIAALNTPSLKVRSFAQVYLVAVTLADRRLVAVGEHGVILFSDDDGASWTQAQVPVDVTLTCVMFSTPQIGWAAGHYGVVLNTTDAGATWTMQLNGIQLNQIALANAQAAAADASTPSNASPALDLALHRASMFAERGPDKPLFTMVLLGPQKLLVLGAYRIAMMTEDGGKTWMDWSLRFYDRLSHDLYDATWIGQDIYVAAETGLIFRSSDAGETFLQIAQVTPPPVTTTMFGIQGAKDGSIITFGVAGNCFRSTDGGNSWNTVNLGTQDDLIASRMLPDGTILIAQESGGLFASRDNGAIFTQSPDFPQIPIADFQPGLNSDLIFVGPAGPTRMQLGPLLPS